jgi:hypothetical protein
MNNENDQKQRRKEKMYIGEAIKHLSNGEKISDRDWLPDRYLALAASGRLVNQDGDECGISPYGARENCWQIWQEPEPPLVDWDAAVKALIEGKKIRRKSWSKEVFLKKNDDGTLCDQEELMELNIRPSWILAEDWQILDN